MTFHTQECGDEVKRLRTPIRGCVIFGLHNKNL